MSTSLHKFGEQGAGGRLAGAGLGTNAVADMANNNAATNANAAVDASTAATTPATVDGAASAIGLQPLGIQSPGDANETPARAETALHSVWNDSLLQGYMQVKLLAGKNIRSNPVEIEKRKPSVLAFFFHLEHVVGASPRLKANKEARVDLVLRLVKDRPDLFPEEIHRKGAELFDRFERENWGENEASDDDSGDDTSAPALSSPASSLRARGPNETSGTVQTRSPPPNDPIWGLKGIMHGVAINPSGAMKSYVLDPEYITEKREAKVIGHNGLTPGDWWPMRRVALFHGAHGHPVGGISGSADTGAYSIVVSGRSNLYHEMDQDMGERLYYSADNSTDNTNPTRVDHVTNRTKSLMTSLRTGRPVRVLRSAAVGRTDRPFAPSVGIRYDGLYTVVGHREAINQRGGKFWQFELVRNKDQRSWQETRNASPTRQQVQAFNRIGRGY